MRVLLRVAYDGTNYSGYQIQENGDTVQEELEKALLDLFRHPVETIGGSRTDAGVHSMGNPVVFDIDTRMKAESMKNALNVRLPEDIRIMSSVEVPEDFHPHRVPSKKTYEYRIRIARTVIPTERLYVHNVHVPMNLLLMQQAAKYLEGEHDFTSFSSVHAQVNSRVRTIYECSVTSERMNAIRRNPTMMQTAPKAKMQEVGDFGDLITIRVTGNGFLYNMVRIIAGTLMEVGRGNMTPEDVKKSLDAMDRGTAGPTAPAKGLTMMGTEFLM